MSKTIKVSEENFDRIEDLMQPREAKNDVVTRLLLVNDKTGELLNVLEGQVRYRESQLAKLKEAAPAH